MYDLILPDVLQVRNARFPHPIIRDPVGNSQPLTTFNGTFRETGMGVQGFHQSLAYIEQVSRSWGTDELSPFNK